MCTRPTAAPSASATRSSTSSPRARPRSGGIATVYQELLLFPELTVAENVFLGHAPKHRLRHARLAARCAGARAQLLDSLDSHDLDVDAKVGTLSVANRQRVEIAKALSQNARVLIMDEPTAALADADVRRLMAVVKRLRDRGVGIIYVSHKLPEIFELADRVTVLRDGALIGTRPIAEVNEQTLVAMMVGREIDHLFPKPEPTIGETVLEVARPLASATGSATSPSSSARGEILGLAGLVGSGRTELALTIFGITPATSGTIEIDGRPVTITSPAPGARPRHRLRARGPRPAGPGPADDRRREHLDGVARAHRPRHLHRLPRRGASARRPRSASSASAPAARSRSSAQLSGGNQQKVVLGKWLETEPRILILDEPTRGIDVGAKAEIHALMGRLAPAGHGDPDDLQRAAGGARHERPGAGHARRPPRRRPSTAPTPTPKPSAPPWPAPAAPEEAA